MVSQFKLKAYIESIVSYVKKKVWFMAVILVADTAL